MYNFPEEEKKILKFWQDKKIFEKSLELTKDKKPFVFYDGPPFATGLPHYGHILSSVSKDVFPRYKTMQGRYVRRRWGWDCHGLPIENIVEKELGINSKKDIESKINVEKFNQVCREKVLTYVADWKKMVERIGRFVEFDNSYKTMDSTYMESVWWALKSLWDKGLIYEGKKVLMYCPHCETPVSKAEVAMDNNYKDITEEAVTVKFKVKNPKKHNLPENTYFLAWTTTPWTLPGNVALAVGEKIKYVLTKVASENYILAKERAEEILKGKEYKIGKEFSGNQLVGSEYEPLYEIKKAKDSGLPAKADKKACYVANADFVNTDEGTSIVHTAVIYGEDDYNLGVKLDLPMIPLLDSAGVFNSDAPEFIKGKYFKDSEKFIKEDLEKRNLLFAKENHTHSYPFCWRCDTQLFYNAISAWFINIQKNKNKLIKLNEKINWYPDHLKHGRFLNILKEAPDWNISRNRYWATPLPFFKCQCGQIECVGSLKELKEKAVNYSEVYNSEDIEKVDLHKDKMDKILLKCKKCGNPMKRVPEVIDCWVESAGMPFAELHYPFENIGEFKKRLPAQYIAEYIAQTRTWFYYMHVLSVLLFNKIAFENVISTGTILNEKGEKLSKSKQNFTDPWEIINQYGVDPLRFYLMASPVMSSEDLFFQDKEVKEARNKIINTLLNVLEFYQTYSTKRQATSDKRQKIKNVLDKWILSKLNNYIKDISLQMDSYSTVKSCRLIKDFIEDLSLWYVRRSRVRFKEESKDKDNASMVLKEVLLVFSKTIAPILPFTAEIVFGKLKYNNQKESVHLEKWPKIEKKYINNKLEEKMDEVRKIVSLALAQRQEKGVKVRQPLAELKIKNQKSKLKGGSELLELIKAEVNVKEIVFDGKIKNEVELDLNITEELKEEGLVREVIRFVQEMRKEAGLKPQDEILLWFESSPLQKVLDKNKEFILKEVKAKSYSQNNGNPLDGGKELLVDNQKILIKIHPVK
ncbi:MAG: isoleucine--tRNA ligase [Patescibacteria group bacterium]